LEDKIGRKIREIRKQKGITLEKLSDVTGLSYSFLSNLENGKHSITVANLSRIADVLNVGMVHFFELSQEDKKPVLIRDAERLFVSEDKVIFKGLSPREAQLFRTFYIKFEEGSDYSPNKMHSHMPGEEQVLVLDGILGVIVKGEEFKLEKGDSLFFRSEEEHEFFPIEKPTRFLLIRSHY